MLNRWWDCHCFVADASIYVTACGDDASGGEHNWIFSLSKTVLTIMMNHSNKQNIQKSLSAQVEICGYEL